ncbi:MAG: hypothetical protein EBY16_07220 [Gammaproteobacteria bacterium]|nr:hypothetical protein [Gammaproteobacteria bacterium]
MPLDSKMLNELGIMKLLQQPYQDEPSFQKVMAAKLRELTFKYLKGELGVVDGPAVKQLRDNLHIIGGLEHFVRSQQPNGAWATDVEMTLLAELLGVNLVVRQKLTDKGMVLSAQPSLDQPTFVLANAHNVHWNPVIEGVEKSAVGDGNCGYNSMALLVKKFSPVPVLFQSQQPRQASSRTLDGEAASIAKMIKDTEACLIQTNTDRQEYDDFMSTLQEENPDKFTEIQTQIDADYKLALQLYLDELPGIEGKSSKTCYFTESCLQKNQELLAQIKAELTPSGPHP